MLRGVFSPGAVNTAIDELFFGNYDSYTLSIGSSPRDKYEVKTTRRGNIITVSSSEYSEDIKMKDTLWDLFTGNSWEGRVRKAQQKAFKFVWEKEKKSEILDHQLNKLK